MNNEIEIECRDDEYCVCNDCWTELQEPDGNLILTLLESLGL